jgi:hypothetical protein
MKPVNLPSGAQRNVESGLVWRQVYNDAGGYTTELPFQYTFRVSAADDIEVYIDDVLAMTLRAGEVALFNTGAGKAGDDKNTVTIELGGGDARMQVAEEKDPGRRTR